MVEWTRRLGVVAIVGCTVACGTEARPQKSDASKPKSNYDAVVLKDFNDRIETYTKLRNKLKGDAPRMKETKDPAEIKASQDALAARLREARTGARPGEIFTQEIRTKFRQLMAPEMKGAEGRATKAAIKEDAPDGVKFAVNATYPEAEALPTMPPNVLAALPQLPEDLEYRIIGKHLILRDVHANIIVDYIPNAIP
jgi:hypothetical protein